MSILKLTKNKNLISELNSYCNRGGTFSDILGLYFLEHDSSRWPFQMAISTNHVSVNKEHLYIIYTMLDQRRRRWADVV